MKPDTKQKKFDAVKMMRDIRNNLSQRYSDYPKLEENELEQIRNKYGIKIKEKI